MHHTQELKKSINAIRKLKKRKKVATGSEEEAEKKLPRQVENC